MLINKNTSINIVEYTKITKAEIKKLNNIDNLNFLMQKDKVETNQNLIKTNQNLNETNQNLIKTKQDLNEKISKIYYVGNEQPEDTKTIWFDNDEDTIESNLNSEILNELTEIISGLNSRITQLEKEVKYLKYEVENSTTNYEFILSEDGDMLLSEDGNNILVEKSAMTDNIITESNDTLLSENNEEILLEIA